MTNFNYRIPDDMAAEVMAEATRLHGEASKGYSFADLEQACLEANIPADIIRKAIKNVEEKQQREQTKRRIRQNRIKEQIHKGLFVGIALLIPTLGVSSLLRSEHEPVTSSSDSREQQSNSPFQKLRVKPGKLEYLTDPKGLSIALRDIGYSQKVQAIVSTDDYESLQIESGQVGDSYEYKGIHNYRIKIIEFGKDDTVTFQIEQQGEKTYSAVERLEKNVNQLQQNSKKLQAQIEKLERERNDNQQNLESKNIIIKQLEEKVNKLQQNSKELETQIAKLESERYTFEQHTNSQNSVVKRLENELDRFQQKSVELQTQVAKLKRERDSNQQNLESKSRTVEQLKNELDRIQKKSQELSTHTEIAQPTRITRKVLKQQAQQIEWKSKD